MIQALEAVVDADDKVRLLEPLHLSAPQRVLVLLLDDGMGQEAAGLSEGALARDWTRPEEDAAWSHLQSGR